MAEQTSNTTTPKAGKREPTACMILASVDGKYEPIATVAGGKAGALKHLKEGLASGDYTPGGFVIVRILWRGTPKVEQQQVAKVTF